MENLERLLYQHDFLRGLSEDQVRFVVSCASNLRFDAGTFLVREGGEANTFYLLRRGKVTLEINVPGRGPVQMESLGEGDVLGMSWLFPPYRWHLDGRATEPVVAIAFDAVCLRRKLEEDHHLGFALTTRMLHQMMLRLERVRLQRLDLYKAEP